MISEYINSIISLFLANPVAQTIGFIAMICVWIAFLSKDDLKTIKMLFIANIFWWILFLLLESYAGLVATIISSIRLYLSIKYKKNVKVFWLIIMLIIIMWIITCNNYISLLPVLCSLIWTYSFFFFSNLTLRIWCLINSILRFIYHYYIWSIWWVINEIVVQILLLITIYNYIWINRYKIIFMSKIKSIFHPYRNIDYWKYLIIKDKDKIYTRYSFSIREKLRNFITKNVKKIKYICKK